MSAPFADRLRDYFARACGRDPGLDALLEASLRASSGTGAGAPGARGVPFELECSLRFTRGRVERRRYIVAWSAAKLGDRPCERIAALAEPLRPPARWRSWVERMRESDHVPYVVTFGVAWDDAPERRTARVYLEQRPIEAILGETGAGAPRSPSALSLEWPLAEPGRAVLRAYHDAAVPAAAAAALDDAAGTPVGAAALTASLRPRFAYRRSDAELAAAEGAAALQLIVAHERLTGLRAPLAAVAAAFDVPPAALDHTLDALPDAMLRVVGAGRSRGGEPHVTLYHGPARGGLAPGGAAP